MDKKKKGFIGIRTKLSVCFILLLIAVMAFINVTVYQIYKSDIEQKEMASMEDASEIFAENIKNLLNGIEEKLVTEIKRSGLFEYMTEGSELPTSEMERKLRSFGILMHFRGLECKNILVMDQNGGEFFYDYQENGMTLSDFRQKSIYQILSLGHDTIFSVRGSTRWRRYEDEPEEMYIVKSYVDSFSLDYCGILCLTVEKKYFKELLGDHNFDTVIYDENGSPLFCSTAEDMFYELDEKEYLWSETEISRNRGTWKMVSYISREAAFHDLVGLIRMLFLTDVALGIIMVIIVHKITEGFLWNVTALTENFKRIHRQEEVGKIEPRSHDETAYLCEQFDSMYHQLQENTEQMILTNTLLDKAEYSALLAQMNPHFLYNSLESISAMARLKGQDEIVRVIHMLSYLLRGTICGGEQEIPLSGELEYISCYLEMQSLITGGRIAWETVVDEKLLCCKVPRLVLQPIVENSILHGVDEMLDDAVIIIMADVRDHKLVLSVSDNGKGADQETMDALLSEEDTEDRKDRAHIGIQSVLKRIHILYGKDYGIAMESEPQKGMTVRLYLPYEENKDFGGG